MDRTYRIEHHINHGHHVFMLVINRGFTTEMFIIPAAWIVIAGILLAGIVALVILAIRSRRRRRNKAA